METVPTDVIANDLAIRLFLFGLAAMSFYEALKFERPRAYIAWAAVALFVVSGAALTPISDAWPVGVTWLSSLVSNPVTWFVLVMGTYLILRPRWVAHRGLASSDELEGVVRKHTTLIESQITQRIEIETTIERIKGQLREISEDRKAIINDYQRMSGLEVRLTDALDALKEAIQAQNKIFADRHWIAEERQREFREETLRSNGQLFLALQAIRARESEQFYAKIIEDEGEQIQAQVKAGVTLKDGDWERWETHANRLAGAMYHWFEVAQGWHPEVKAWVNDVPAERLTALDWGPIDHLFQNANQVIHYKTLITRLSNWQHVRSHVVTAIHMAAFGGPGAAAVLEKIPGGGPTLESVKEKPDANSRGDTLRRLSEGKDEGGIA